jgi:hypothetical protein
MHFLLVSLLISHQHSIEDMDVWAFAMSHTQFVEYKHTHAFLYLHVREIHKSLPTKSRY